MDNILLLINTIFVPEILEFIKKKKNATGAWPTLDEVKAEVMRVHDEIKSEGEAFLNRK